VITNEPSPLLTPIATEPPGFPEEVPPSPSPRAAAWFGLLKAFLIWVASVLLLVFVPLIVALPYLAYTWIKSGPPRADELMADKTLLFLSILGVLPTHLITLGVVWLIVTEGGRYPFWKTIGFEWPKSLSPIKWGLISAMLAGVLLGIGALVTSLYGGNKTQLDLLVESSTQARWATALIAILTAPLVEEVIYRGVLYSAVERVLGIGWAIAIISMLFAGVHVFQYSNNIAVIIVITLLSISLTVVRGLTGKVLPSFVIHLVFNGVQSLILLLTPFIDKAIFDKGEKVVPTAPAAFELLSHLISRLI
jgi:CAAX protease family protein